MLSMEEFIVPNSMAKIQFLKELWSQAKVNVYFQQNRIPPPSWQDPEDPMNLGYIDYYCGKVIQVDFTGNKIKHYLYDKHNGHGQFAKIARSLSLVEINS